MEHSGSLHFATKKGILKLQVWQLPTSSVLELFRLKDIGSLEIECLNLEHFGSILECSDLEYSGS